eukprot:4127495-Prymnesium_polylepis.1
MILLPCHQGAPPPFASVCRAHLPQSPLAVRAARRSRCGHRRVAVCGLRQIRVALQLALDPLLRVWCRHVGNRSSG